MDRIDKDEELVCPLCGGRLFWMPVSHIYACEHCKQSYSERNGVYMKKKRKSTAEKSSAVGDAAKLREAVIETQSVIAKCMDILNKIPDECGYGGLLDDVADELCDLLEEHIKPALAAPPRNCDVYTSDELKVIFNSELASELPIANEHEKNLVTITAMGVIDTLLAATEKEGANYGNE